MEEERRVEPRTSKRAGLPEPATGRRAGVWKMGAKIFEELKRLLSLRSLQARIFIIVLVAGVIPSMIVRYGILDNYEEHSVQHRIATVQNQSI